MYDTIGCLMVYVSTWYLLAYASSFIHLRIEKNLVFVMMTFLFPVSKSQNLRHTMDQIVTGLL